MKIIVYNLSIFWYNILMKNYINNQHSYYTLDYYLKEKYRKKVFKVALNGNFTCPNRDGTKAYGGCIFCSDSGSGDFSGNKEDSLIIQFNEVKDIISKKWPDSKYIAYFQANSNTYAPLDKLKSLYEEALSLHKDIVGLDIATRPDCISDECLEYLATLNTQTDLTIELGLQTIHENTQKYLNLCYNTEDFDNCVKRLREKNINVVVHIINGLPYETKDMMLNTIKHINNLDIQGIKIHSLFVLKGSVLATHFLNNEFKLLSLAEYVDVVCEQLSILKDDIVVHRISGDPPKDLLIEPTWSLKKFVVMNEIDKEMKKRKYYQGINFQK